MARTVVWRLLRAVPPVSIAVGLALALAGVMTAHQILAASPCAVGWDNPITAWMMGVFAVGIGTSLALIIAGANLKDRASLRAGGLGLGFGLLALMVGWVLAGAPYGWHCPTL